MERLKGMKGIILTPMDVALVSGWLGGLPIDKLRKASLVDASSEHPLHVARLPGSREYFEHHFFN
jgi:hypothetical protein